MKVTGERGIEVYCDAESHNKGPRTRIATFVMANESPWHALPARNRSRDGFVNNPDLTVFLQGNRPLNRPYDDRTEGVPVRGKYDLRCKLCPLSLSATPKTLHPHLDRLADDGVSSIALSELVAIVV